MAQDIRRAETGDAGAGCARLVACAEAVDRADSGNYETLSPRGEPRCGGDSTHRRRLARDRPRRISDQGAWCAVPRAPATDGRKVETGQTMTTNDRARRNPDALFRITCPRWPQRIPS